MALTKVTRGGITADAVDGTKIDDDAINSEHYAATSVDNAHINDLAASKLTGTLANARLSSNISDAGTEGTKIAVGTTAQRGSTTGQWRFNSTTGFFEGYNGTAFSTLELTPGVSSVDDAEVDSAGGGNQTIVVTGTNFTSGGVIAFVGSSADFNAATTTFNSATQVTAVAPKSSFLNAQEPYKVKFTSTTGKSATSSTGLIYVDNDPVWSTAAGNVGNVGESTTITNIQLTATDPESDTVTYAETTSNLSGAGFALSSAGVISGTTGAVGSDTTTSFTVRATANSKTTDRAFNIVTKNLVTSATLFNATNWDNDFNPTFTSGTSGVGLVDNNDTAFSIAPSTAVTLSNVNGSSGTLANMNVVAGSSRMQTHYNSVNKINFGQTFWAVSTGDSHDINRNSGWWGVYTGSNEATTWFTLDAGASPSFKIRKLTGDWTWRTAGATFKLYGTDNISSLGASTFSTSGLSELYSLGNPGATMDSGYFTGAFYRYYVFYLTASGSGYDWGLDNVEWYGDYY